MIHLRAICLVLLVGLTSISYAQKKDKKKIMTISRTVNGEMITTDRDTLIGKIKIKNAEDYYVTSITFKEGSSSPRLYTAYDVLWFRQVVPYPDREAFGVEHVFYKSAPHPDDPRKKIFVPTDK